MKGIIEFEESNKIQSKFFDIFSGLFLEGYLEGSYYILYYLIKENFVSSKTIPFSDLHFVHYMGKEIQYHEYDEYYEYIMENYEILSKNDWELHKQLIEEGVNPNEIAKIIRNDEIEKLQEMSSQNDFNFNQFIEPSLYERYSFINQENVTLIDYAAFFSSIKCFKYLLMNGANVKNTGKYAIAGGNEEIIHLCIQNHSIFEDAYSVAIMFHRNNIFKYIYENSTKEILKLEELGTTCVSFHNYDIFTFLIKEGMKINDNIISEATRNGNTFFIKHFLKENQPTKDILFLSIKLGNIELVKYILEQKGIDINTIILIYYIF